MIKQLLDKWDLVLKAILIVLPLLILKYIIFYLGWEIIAVGPVVTALVAGVFFVIAIILSGVLADFKESEKIPGELTASLEALYKDSRLVGTAEDEAKILAHVQELTHTLSSNFHRQGNWKLSEVNQAIDWIDEDIRSIAAKGAPIALVIKLRNELGNIKRLSNRVEVIKETSFLPAGYAIAEFSMVGAILILMLCKIDPYYEGLALVGVIAAILISVVFLIKDMDNPFEGRVTVDLRQLDKIDRYLDSREDIVKNNLQKSKPEIAGDGV